jgi:hypothetical protein
MGDLRRRRWIGPAVGLAAALAGGVDAGSPPAPAPAAPARDPALVLADLLAEALAADSSAALILFLARHGDEASSQRAREALAARGAPDPAPPGGTDGGIVAAFDAARLAGPDALAAFARANRRHPLGVEAMRPFWSR